jgi:hypothetical protein
MDYGKLLSRAWNIVWNHKFMIILGFLAALGAGGSGANFNFNLGGRDVDMPPGVAQDIERMIADLAVFVPLLLGVACLAMLLGVFLWLIRLVAQAGMIDAAARLDEGEKVTFGQAFGAGTAKILPMVGLNIVLYGVFLIVAIVAIVALFGTVGVAIAGTLGGEPDLEALIGGFGLIFLCVGLLACLSIPLYFIISVIYPFAQRGVVLRNLGVMAAIGHAWNVIKRNLADVLLLIVLFFFLQIVVSVLAALILVPLALLIMGPVVLNMLTTGGIGIGSVLTLVGGGICLGVLAAIVNAILVAFRSTTVTLAYQEFLLRDQPAKPAWNP